MPGRKQGEEKKETICIHQSQVSAGEGGEHF